MSVAFFDKVIALSLMQKRLWLTWWSAIGAARLVKSIDISRSAPSMAEGDITQVIAANQKLGIFGDSLN